MVKPLGSTRPRAAGSASTYLAVGIGPRPWRRRPEGLARPLASVPSVRAGRRARRPARTEGTDAKGLAKPSGRLRHGRGPMPTAKYVDADPAARGRVLPSGLTIVADAEFASMAGTVSV